ncbi:MAG: hypothetical protein ACREMB_19695 [Candidatus Rokuibacteriota bacterium]
MTADEFYERFYATSGLPKHLVTATLRSLAAALEMPEATLRPGDRFGEELKPVRGWELDDGTVVLSAELTDLAERAGIAIDLQNVSTLDDYIRSRISVEIAIVRRV